MCSDSAADLEPMQGSAHGAVPARHCSGIGRSPPRALMTCTVLRRLGNRRGVVVLRGANNPQRAHAGFWVCSATVPHSDVAAPTSRIEALTWICGVHCACLVPTSPVPYRTCTSRILGATSRIRHACSTLGKPYFTPTSRLPRAYCTPTSRTSTSRDTSIRRLLADVGGRLGGCMVDFVGGCCPELVGQRMEDGVCAASLRATFSAHARRMIDSALVKATARSGCRDWRYLQRTLSRAGICAWSSADKVALMYWPQVLSESC